jgi:ferredoxin-nitrate reductase
MTKTGKVNKLKQHTPEPFLQIHPQDAMKRDIRDNELVNLSSRQGDIRIKAKYSTDIKPG